MDLSQMKRLIEIDKENMTATVEPGLMLMEFQSCWKERGCSTLPTPGKERHGVR